ncbi:Dabb family protein [Actinomycetospora termitidis]|uniref:Dabb family protein n=1 Tax=Actinomycetospora termitidis TaxID=3053470 RepID=A0ABT7MGA8_9PSEU|nr:Dabb family protein [Actinomycetospora sp. Odt1-22]MDL5159705.1 Dabb family protein [Actinomycetospora sp. Odt1-22]
MNGNSHDGGLEVLIHCLTLRFTTSASDADVAAFARAVERLPGQVGVPMTTRHGVDLGERPTNGDYAVVSEFRNAEDFRTYLGHPAHRALPANHVESMLSVQFVLEDE